MISVVAYMLLGLAASFRRAVVYCIFWTNYGYVLGSAWEHTYRTYCRAS